MPDMPAPTTATLNVRPGATSSARHRGARRSMPSMASSSRSRSMYAAVWSPTMKSMSSWSSSSVAGGGGGEPASRHAMSASPASFHASDFVAGV